MWKEFKEFAMKGNVLDLAIGVIIGGAFGKIVTSLVNDVIMPLVSLLLGKVDLSKMAYPIAGKTMLKYGAFLQSIIDFLIVAFSIFLFVKLMNRFNKKKEAAAEAPKVDSKEQLLVEIRDLLKQKSFDQMK